jgi:hypothetical protein
MIEAVSPWLLHCRLRRNGIAFCVDAGSGCVALGKARETAIHSALGVLETIGTAAASSLGGFGSKKCDRYEHAAGNGNHETCSHGLIPFDLLAGLINPDY